MEGTELDEVYDHLAGTPEAMTSYAAMIADQTDMSLLQQRVDLNKATGSKTPIFGIFEEGDTVAEFDNAIANGESKVDTIRSLSESGLVVVDYFVVLDREEGGTVRVTSETGVEITPALGLSSMIKMLRAENLINNTQLDNVVEYISKYGEPHAKTDLGIAA